MKKLIIKSRNIFAIHAWNRRAGKHKDKAWHSKNRKRGKVSDEEYEE
jgi:hypothetical protein